MYILTRIVFLMMLAVESANNRCVSSEMCVSCDEARMKYLRA